MYLDGFVKFLEIYQKNIFSPLLKKKIQKTIFVSQKYDFLQRSDDLNRFHVKFPF